MKRSLWMVAALLAGVVGLIAVAQAQKSLRYSEHEASITPVDGDEYAETSSEDPWPETLAAEQATAETVDQSPLEHVPLAPAQDADSTGDDTIPPGPGLDFRRFGSKDADEQIGGIDDGGLSEDLDEPVSIAEGDDGSQIPSAAQSGPTPHTEADLLSEPASKPAEPALFDAPSEESDDAPAELPTNSNAFSEAEAGESGDLSGVTDGSRDAEPAPVDETTLGPQTPTLTLEKIAPATVRMGEPLHYEIVVRNASTTPAYSVVVTDPIAPGAQLSATEPEAENRQGKLVWVLGTLGPQKQRRLSVELQPTREGDIGSVAEVTFSARAAARTLVAQPKLSLEVVPDAEQIQMGEAVTLTFRVSNPGTGTATGIVLIEPIPEPLQHPAGAELEYEIGKLEPGQTREVPLTLTAVGGGQAVNRATVVAEGGLEVSASTTVQVVAPQLGVTLTGPRRRYLGRQASYTVAVANPGQVPATGVRVVSYVPEGMQFVEAGSGGQFDPRNGTVSWSLTELGGSQTAQLSMELMPTSPGQKLQRVQATAERGLEAQSQLTTDVEGISAVLLEVVDVDDPVEVGRETAYEVRIVSQGSKSSTNVRLTAELPLGIEFLGSTGPTEGKLHEGKVVFEPLDRLGPGVDAVYRIRARGTRAGDQRFKVELSTDQMPNPVREEESTRVYAD